MKLNPYAPPSTQSSTTAPAPPVQPPDLKAPLPFSGGVSEDNLQEFLTSYGHISWPRLVALAIGLACLFVAFSGVAAAATVSLVGFVAILITVSTMRYRRLMFKNKNPSWSMPIDGEVNADGIVRRRAGVSTFLRWDWFCGAVVCDSVIALVPATQLGQPLLLSRTMFNADDWPMVQEAGRSIGQLQDDQYQDENRRRENLAMLRDRHRSRSEAPPPGAICFEGMLREQDFEDLPGKGRRRRPIRTYIINSSLALLGALLLGAISNAAFDQPLLLPLIAAAYIGSMIYFGRRRRRSENRVVYYLLAFANNQSLVTDFNITRTRTDWDQLSRIDSTEDRVVLGRNDSAQLIVARRDMFDSDKDWIEFLKWSGS